MCVCMDFLQHTRIGSLSLLHAKNIETLSNEIAIEVHCCIYSIVNKGELLEQITAGKHSIEQKVSIRRSSSVV